MALLVLALTLALAGVALAMTHHSLGQPTGRRPLQPYGIALLLLALVTAMLSATTIIQAKNAGVLTTFGAASERTLDPGLHVKAP